MDLQSLNLIKLIYLCSCLLRHQLCLWHRDSIRDSQLLSPTQGEDHKSLFNTQTAVLILCLNENVKASPASCSRSSPHHPHVLLLTFIFTQPRSCRMVSSPARAMSAGKSSSFARLLYKNEAQFLFIYVLL